MRGPRYTPPLIRSHIGKRCPCCEVVMTRRGKSRPSRDHLTPKSRGGTFENGNQLVCCRQCNNDKGDLTIEEWAVVLADAGDRRAAIVRRLVDEVPSPGLRVAAE